MTKAEEAIAALEAMMASGGTLPSTPSGKVNVIALCKRLGLKPPQNYAQHFHRNERLKAIVNSAATSIGMAPIGHTSRTDEPDVLTERMSRIERQATADARDAVEQRSASEALLAENAELHREVARLRLRLDGAEERLRIFEFGGVPPAIR